MEEKEIKKEDGIKFFSFATDKNLNVPVYAESKSKLWIPYGENNLYDRYLVSLMNTSSKHNSLLAKTARMTAGKGFSDVVGTEEFIANEHGKEDMNKIAFKNAYDLALFGGFCYAITWSNDKKTIARKTYIDFSKVRIAKDLEDDSEQAQLQAKGVPFYWMSSDWENTRKAKNKPELIQGFSEEHKDSTTQLVWDIEYRPGVDFYSLPSYISAMDWIELDYQIATFHLASVKNGFTPSMIISFKGSVPDEDEMRTFKRKLNEEYSGAENGSRVFVTFSEDPENAPDFIPVSLGDSDERFILLEQTIQQNIIVAHGASPIVAGVSVGGKLGSSSEVLEAEVIFQKNAIDSKQDLLLNSYNKIAKINGVKGLELKRIESVEELEEGEEGEKSELETKKEIIK